MASETHQTQTITSPGRLRGWKPFRRILFGCPGCEEALSAPEGDAAKEAKCPACGRTILTPDPATGKPAMAPAYSSHGGVPAQIPNTGDSGRDSGSATSPLSNPSLHQTARDRAMGDVEDTWSEAAGREALGLARLKRQIPLEVSGPWLGMAAAVLVLAGALFSYFNRSDESAPTSDTLEDQLPDTLRGQLELVIKEFNDRPVGFDHADLLRPTEDLVAKIKSRDSEFPKGHRLALANRPTKPTEPAPDGARRVFTLGSTDGHPVRLLFEEESPGRWLLDWESAVGYCTNDWAAFVRNAPDGPHIMRVIGVADDYFNYEFTRRRGLLCVKLRDLHNRAQCWGYARRESVVGQQLTPWLARGAAATITLELEFPPPDPDHPERPRNQVWIRDVVRSSWFVD